MRILILGGDGMLGHKIFQVLTRRFDTFATFRNPKGLWSRFPMYAAADPACVLGGVNALDFDSVVRAMVRVRPTVVINCIGIIKQLNDSQDPIVSLTLNSLFPHQLADLCDAIGARMFHVSTDCVFSGRKGNYTEDDMPDPEDLYGRTKLLGEVNNRTNCLTVRTSIIGRDFLKRTGLLEWLLANQGGGVKGYKNAIYTGLPTQVLARIIGDVIEHHPKLSGLYHIASQPISKYDLLVSIRDAINLDIKIEPCDDPRCDRSLNPARFVSGTGYSIPGWAEMLAELATDPTPYDEWRKSHATQ